MIIEPPQYSLDETLRNIEMRVINLELVIAKFPEYEESWREVDEILEYFEINWSDLNKFEVLEWCLPYYAYARLMELIDELGPAIKTIDLTKEGDCSGCED